MFGVQIEVLYAFRDKYWFKDTFLDIEFLSYSHFHENETPRPTMNPKPSSLILLPGGDTKRTLIGCTG